MNKSNLTWVVGYDVDIEAYRPCRVYKTEAKRFKWEMFDRYDECMDCCKKLTPQINR